MNRIFRNIVFLLLLFPLAVMAQDDWEKPAGGIEDARVVIEKEKVIKLRPVSRRFKSIQFEVPKAVPITLNYQLPNVREELPSLQVIVRPKTMKTQPLDKLFSFNGKLGYGNYRTPFVHLNISNKRNDEYMINAYLNHLSSSRGPYKIGNGLDSEYNSNIGGSGKYFLNNFTLWSGFNYRNYIYNIYGYDPDQMSASPETFFIRQKLNVFSFNTGLADNNFKNSFDNDIDLRLNYLVNSNNDPADPEPGHEYNEFLYGTGYDFKGKLDDHWALNARLGYTGYFYNNLEDTVVGRSRRLVEVSPEISYNTEEFKATLGVKAFNENDPIANGKSNFRVYPTASILYQLGESHMVSGMVSGSVEEVSADKVLNENPYINKEQQVNHNLNNFKGSFKLAGNLLPNLDYQLKYEFNHYNRIFFYVNNLTDTARFDMVYDEGGVNVSSVGLHLNYILNDKLNISTNTIYYSYKTTDVEQAWHRPALIVDLRADFKIIEKLTGNVSYNLMSGIKAQTVSSDVKTLETIHDINLGLNLSLTERAGIFINLINIANSNYQLYNNYPVKGFQVIGGFSFKF